MNYYQIPEVHAIKSSNFRNKFEGIHRKNPDVEVIVNIASILNGENTIEIDYMPEKIVC